MPHQRLTTKQSSDQNSNITSSELFHPPGQKKSSDNVAVRPQNANAASFHESRFRANLVAVPVRNANPAVMQAQRMGKVVNDKTNPPRQERQLPHEGWHVVQQMQGRVLPLPAYRNPRPLSTRAQAQAKPVVQRTVTKNNYPKKDDVYTSYDQLPHKAREIIEKGSIPQEYAQKIGEFYDETATRQVWKAFVKKCVETKEENDKEFSGSWEDFLIEECLWDTFLEVKKKAQELEEADNSNIRKNLDSGYYEGKGAEIQSALEKLNNMSLDRLKRIATLEAGKLVKGTFTVTDPKVAPALAKVCKTFQVEWEKVNTSIDEMPNQFLEHADEEMEKDVTLGDAWGGIKETVEYILNIYPPDKNAYIGLGASPAVVLKYLEILRAKNGDIETYDVPLSGLSSARSTIKEQWETGGNPKQRLKSFIDSYLGTFSNKKKQVVVMDFSSGGSLFAAEYIIGMYLSEKLNGFQMRQVIPLALTEATKSDSWSGGKVVDKSNIVGVDLHTKEFKAFVAALQASFFKDYGYRSSEKNDTGDILRGTHVKKQIIGGYKRLIKDLTEYFKLS